LLRKAARFHNLDLGRSWLIGDRYCDIAAASTAGVRSILVSTGQAGNDRDSYSVEPNRRCPDLGSAAEEILKALA
jgi:histidinol phosphatase-like enzyme